MRIKTIKIVSAIMAVCCIFAVFATPVTVDAGVSPMEVENIERLSASEWYTTKDIAGKSTAAQIEFTSDSNGDSRAIYKTKFSNLKEIGWSDFMTAEFNVRIDALEEGKKFGFLYGLAYSSAKTPSDGCGFLSFTASAGRLYVGVDNYGKKSAITEVYKSNSPVGDFGDDIAVKIVIDINGVLTLKIGESAETVISDNGVTEGFVGFGQTGAGTVAYINDISLSGYKNETPQNTDFIERFEHGEYNAKNLFSASKAVKGKDCYVRVENGELVFKNVGTGYVSTKNAYSNFDLSFDVSIEKDALTSENKYNAYVSAGFSVCFGLKSHKDIMDEACEIRFDREKVSLFNEKTKSIINVFVAGELVSTADISEVCNIFNNDAGRETFTLCVRVENTSVSVFLVRKGQAGLKCVLTYDLGYTPLGCVQLRSNGVDSVDQNAETADFSIDNFSVANFDYKRLIGKIDFKTNKWNTNDSEYVDTWKEPNIVS